MRFSRATDGMRMESIMKSKRKIKTDKGNMCGATTISAKIEVLLP